MGKGKFKLKADAVPKPVVGAAHPTGPPKSKTKRKVSLPKLIEKYYADLADFAKQNVLFEMGTRHAFHRLMADAGMEHKWTLIAEPEKKVGGKTIRPDGTFKDEMNLVRGYWEAKDTDDKLDKEIEKKRKAGYPLNNIRYRGYEDVGPLLEVSTD